MLGQRTGAWRAGRKVQQVQLLQGPAIPPGHQANTLGFSRLNVNPRAVPVDNCREQLVQKRQFQTVRHVTVGFQFPQKILHAIALGHNHNDGL